MKIGIISNLFEPYTRGGAEKIARLTAQGLSNAHEVFVISTEPWRGRSSLNFRCAKENGLRVYRFYPLNIYYYLNDYRHNPISRLIWHGLDVFNLHSARQIRKILREEQPDIIISHNLKGIGYLIPRVIHGQGIKHIQVLHDVQYAVPSGIIIAGQENSFIVNGFLTKIYQKICSRLLANVSVVISPSVWLLGYYQQLGFFKNSIKKYLANPAVPIITKGLKSTSTPPYTKYLFIGQIEYHKGVDFLAQIFSEMPNMELVIVGRGALLDNLKRKYQQFSNIKFTGQVENELLNNYFVQADYLIVPTLCYENSPTVIYESYAAGTPVIVADIGGAAELVHDGLSGYSFPAGDREALRAVIKAAVNNPLMNAWQKYCLSLANQYSLTNYLANLQQIIMDN